MRSATSRARNLAQRLLAFETSSGETQEAEGLAAFRVCERLRQPFSTLVGVAGFRSLLSRALALANDDVRWLKAVHVRADGSLEVLDGMRLSDPEIAAGATALLAQLIGLLEIFIGVTLTLHLLQETWPEALLGDPNSDPEIEP